MKEFIESRYERFVNDLETVVQIDSPSTSIEGVGRVAAFYEKRFGAIGWTARLLEMGAGVPCLEVLSPAVQASDACLDLVLIGHMDTVFPVGTAGERPFSIDGSIARGPGVNDMKSGLTAVLHIAETLHHFGIDRRLRLAVAFNGDEEAGSGASRGWLDRLAQRAGAALVFEPCRPGWRHVLRRKGGGVYRLTCRGRAAHAGVAPETGASAIRELALKILAAEGLARPEAGTTISATLVKGGTADNVIAARATASIDVRVADPLEAQRVCEAFAQLAGRGEVSGVEVLLAGGIDRPPMVPSEKTFALWRALRSEARQIGIPAGLVDTGGGSDGNYCAALGIPTIDGLGPVGEGSHSLEEYVDLDSITPAVLLVSQFVDSIAAGRVSL